MVAREFSKGDGFEMWTIAKMGVFYSEHRHALHTHATRLLKDSARAEEVVQDALIKVLLAAPELSSEDHALSYLHRTIENLCIDIFRTEGRRPNLVVLDEVTSEVELKWQGNEDLSEIISSAEDSAIVRQALSLLSPAERAALVMWEVEGRSTSDIARELGVKESTVRHTVSRARKSLRKVLSEIIIDEERGLTAIDVLSTTYKKAAHVAKKSSKIALSVILVFFAFLGFNAMPNHENLISVDVPSTKSEIQTSEISSPTNKATANEQYSRSKLENKTSNQLGTVSAKPAPLNYAGLDKEGVPTGFTVTDSTGNLGSLFITRSFPKTTEDGIELSFISKTKAGAPNIFLSQDIAVDGSGTSYKASISAGIHGNWVPLNLTRTTVDIERLASGNYLITATMVVDSVVESPINVPSSANGLDLDSAPKSVVTRLLLSAGKTQVLAQAVLVNGSGKAGKA